MKNTVLIPIMALAILGAVTLTPAAEVSQKPAPAVKTSTKTNVAKDWKDPDIIIDGINFRDANLSQIAEFFRESIGKDKIDVIVPNKASELTVSLRLAKCTFTEAFTAMNALFEAGRTPVRWELFMNGTRPTALLYCESDFPSQTPEIYIRTAIYVGDLVGDGLGKDMKELADSIELIVSRSGTMKWNIEAHARGEGGVAENPAVSRGFNMACHEASKLLIVRGTQDEIQFVRQVVEELRKRKSLETKTAVAPVKP